MQNAPQNKAAGQEQEVELLDLPPGTQQPPGGGLDILRYLPLLLKLVEGFATGIGKFVTSTPFGRFEVSIKKVG
jgi:hypothetical protein